MGRHPPAVDATVGHIRASALERPAVVACCAIAAAALGGCISTPWGNATIFEGLFQRPSRDFAKERAEKEKLKEQQDLERTRIAQNVVWRFNLRSKVHSALGNVRHDKSRRMPAHDIPGLRLSWHA